MNAESARDLRVIIKRLLGSAGLPHGGRSGHAALGLGYMAVALGLFWFVRRTEAATGFAEILAVVLAPAE